MRLNPDWCEDMSKRLGEIPDVTFTSPYRKAIQYLVAEAVRRNRTYKLINCGAGVMTFTTETDKCPCCRRPI